MGKDKVIRTHKSLPTPSPYTVIEAAIHKALRAITMENTRDDALTYDALTQVINACCKQRMHSRNVQLADRLNAS